jgi:predicted CXXCH cytochrome family protein
MRPLLLLVLLLSCASDEARRAPAPAARAAPPRAEPARTAAPEPTTRATEPQPPATALAAREPAPDPRAQTRRAAHDALAENCGECHEGHRSTNAKALAVFDLDQPDWPARFTPPRFDSALRRLTKKSEPASAAFIAFRDAELAPR